MNMEWKNKQHEALATRLNRQKKWADDGRLSLTEMSSTMSLVSSLKQLLLTGDTTAALLSDVGSAI